MSDSFNPVPIWFRLALVEPTCCYSWLVFGLSVVRVTLTTIFDGCVLPVRWLSCFPSVFGDPYWLRSSNDLFDCGVLANHYGMSYC